MLLPVFTLAQETFTNPVINADVADPSVIRWGDTYYAAGTSSEWAPFYPIFKSQDLVNWKQVGHVFQQKPAWTESSFWAPELYIHKGKVYCYYTARRKSDHISYIGVAVADHPEGPYHDQGELITMGTEDIDAFVYNDNGQLYITWKAYGLDPRPIEILGSRLSADGLHLEGETFTVLKDEEEIGMEGQCIFKEGDWYYMLYSARGCCGSSSDYEVRVARAKSMTVLFENYDQNPILMRSDDFLSCGHGTLVDTPDGRRFYLCHAYQYGGDFYKGRQPILQELVMGEDGWPAFKGGRNVKAELPVPFPGTKQEQPGLWRDDFRRKKLDVAWTWNYPYNEVSAQPAGHGWLALCGKPVKENAEAVLCLRTPYKDYCFSCCVKNEGGSMRGITLYGDAMNYVALVLRDGSLQLLDKRKGKEKILHQMSMKQKKVTLEAEIQEGSKVIFYYQQGKNRVAVNEKPLDVRSAMPWDRGLRPGLISGVVAGGAEKPAMFAKVRLEK